MTYCENCDNYNPQTCTALVRQMCAQGAICGGYRPIAEDGEDYNGGEELA